MEPNINTQSQVLDVPKDPSLLPLVLTVEEAANVLRLDKKTVYEAIRAKKFPARKVGARYCIYRDALINWLMGDPIPVAGGAR